MTKSRPKRLKEIPVFRSEDEEREFWATADSAEYSDWSKAKRVVFPNLSERIAAERGRAPRRAKRARE